MKAILENKIDKIGIKDVLHVLKFHINLFSVTKLVSNHLNALSNLHKCIVKSYDGQIITIAPRKQNS